MEGDPAINWMNERMKTIVLFIVDESIDVETGL